MTARILLVYPDYRNEVFPGAHLPLGLGWVAASLRAAGIEYDFIDLNVEPHDALQKRVRDAPPDFLGISMMSYRYGDVYRMLDEIKRDRPGIRIIAGGPHLSANRNLVLEECPAIDLGVVGEGERTLIDLLRGRAPADVPGVVHREDGKVVFSGDREYITDLDSLPFPTYESFPLAAYGTTMSLASSRGCPYHCIFCGAPRLLGRKWRRRSAACMFSEFRHWHDTGFREFVFNDSNFAVDRERVREFCAEVLRSGRDAGFTADGLRADHVDRGLLEEMRRAGFHSVTFGVESGSERVLQRLKKGETVARIDAAIGDAVSLGYRVLLFFIIGTPGETPADIRLSFQLALKYPVQRVHFFNLTPIRGTEFHDWAREQGYIGGRDEAYPAGIFGFSDRALLRTDTMTVDEISSWMKKARGIERLIEWRQRVSARLAASCGLSLPATHPLVRAVARAANASPFLASAMALAGRVPRRILRPSAGKTS